VYVFWKGRRERKDGVEVAEKINLSRTSCLKTAGIWKYPEEE